MVDQLSELERLNKLRESGALSLAEFEREKLRIFDRRSDIERSTSHEFRPVAIFALIVAAILAGTVFWLKIPEARTKSSAPEESLNGTPRKPITLSTAPSSSPNAETEAGSRAASETKEALLVGSTWLGAYRGTFEGEVDGDLAISRGAKGNLSIKLDVGGTNCTGGFSGHAAASDGKTIIARVSRGDTCHLTLFRRGNRVDVSEDRCSEIHGAMCSFNGSARR